MEEQPPPRRAGAPGVERRSEPRVAVNLPARLFYGPKYSRWTDCVIKDRSTQGAKIEVPASFELSPRVILLEYRSGVAFLAQPRWRKWDMVGLRLEVSYDLREPVDPSLEAVREAWLALSPAFGGSKT
jgi:hypothetical protein